jgi:predicted TIM-barrel fold metal-dependent hydrolase
VLPRTDEPLGRRRYWPIFEAACASNLPIAVHVGGTNGHPSTGGGWPSYYMEEHTRWRETMQAVLSSLVFEGVFERFPQLRVRDHGGRARLDPVAQTRAWTSTGRACAAKCRI